MMLVSMRYRAFLALMGMSSFCVVMAEENDLGSSKMELRIELLQRLDTTAEIGLPPSDVIELNRSWREKSRVPERNILTKAELKKRRQDALVEQMLVIENALSRDQLERLDQLCLQAALISSLEPHAHIIGQVVELTEDQKKRLVEKEAELGKELKQMMVNFHQASQKELQQFLTAKQKTNWRSKVGQTFEFESVWSGLNLLIDLR